MRSMRFGEADRILHVFTERAGRVSAIAKGVRRTRSRFGGRLEPFFRVNLVLYRGRGELSTVTQVHTVQAHAALRQSAPALEAAARGVECLLRLMAAEEANRPAYNLLCRYLSLVDKLAGAVREDAPSTGQWQALVLTFRLKLMLAAGFAPQLRSCSLCGSDGPLVAFCAGEGGVVCDRCKDNSFSIGEETYAFMDAALTTPMGTPAATSSGALGQVDRAVRETLDYHAHVGLSSVIS